MTDTNKNDIFELKKEIEKLKEEIIKLNKDNNKLNEKVQKNKKTTKLYYETNKQTFIDKANERLKKLSTENPEKIKEYRRTAYQNRKIKLQKIQ